MRCSHLFKAFVFCGALGLAGTQANAQDAKALHLQTDASMCANCHGTEGRTVQGSAVPAIAGLPRDYFVQQMQAFKSGQRPATIMHQISKGLTDPQIESLAAYFSILTR